MAVVNEIRLLAFLQHDPEVICNIVAASFPTLQIRPDNISNKSQETNYLLNCFIALAWIRTRVRSVGGVTYKCATMPRIHLN